MKLISPKFGRSGDRLAKARRTPLPRPNRLAGYYLLHMLGMAFPLCSGLWLYGWRAIEVVALVMASAALGVLIWRQIGARGAALHWPHAMWLAMLLGIMLPPHLLLSTGLGSLASPAIWPLAPAAGLLLAMLLWAQGGIGFSRMHPLLLTYLLLAACFEYAMTPHVVLHRSHMFTGDLADVAPPGSKTESPQEPWISLSGKSEHDAFYVQSPASQRLSNYTQGRPMHRAAMPMEAMLRDQMPPLENLVVGGHPGPIGASSSIAVIVGGLFLLYRGLIDYRVPLIIVLVAFAGFAVLPGLLMPGAHVDWAAAITFASYEMMASPVLLMAFFIASSKSVCPVGRRSRVLFAMVVGLLTIVCQFYLSAAYAAYLALALAGAVAPSIEQRFDRRDGAKQPDTVIPGMASPEKRG